MPMVRPSYPLRVRSSDNCPHSRTSHAESSDRSRTACRSRSKVVSRLTDFGSEWVTTGRSSRPWATSTSQHARSEEHTSELQSLMRISYAVYCLKKKKYKNRLSPTKYQQNNLDHY